VEKMTAVIPSGMAAVLSVNCLYKNEQKNKKMLHLLIMHELHGTIIWFINNR